MLGLVEYDSDEEEEEEYQQQQEEETQQAEEGASLEVNNKYGNNEVGPSIDVTVTDSPARSQSKGNSDRTPNEIQEEAPTSAILQVVQSPNIIENDNSNTPIDTTTEYTAETFGPQMPPGRDIGYHSPETSGAESPTAPLSPYSYNRRLIRNYTAPTIVSNVAIPHEPQGSVDPQIAANFARFLEMKKKGTHFNHTLDTKRAARNPSLLQNILQYALTQDKDDDADEEKPFELDPMIHKQYASNWNKEEWDLSFGNLCTGLLGVRNKGELITQTLKRLQDDAYNRKHTQRTSLGFVQSKEGIYMAQPLIPNGETAFALPDTQAVPVNVLQARFNSAAVPPSDLFASASVIPPISGNPAPVSMAIGAGGRVAQRSISTAERIMAGLDRDSKRETLGTERREGSSRQRDQDRNRDRDRDSDRDRERDKKRYRDQGDNDRNKRPRSRSRDPPRDQGRRRERERDYGRR